MFSISITVDTSGIDRVLQSMPTRAATGVEISARHFESVAKREAPVDSGNLQNQIEATAINRFFWRVSDNTEYGIYQEFGVNHPYTINAPVYIKGVGWRFIRVHPGFRAQPFWMPAAEATRPVFYAAMGQIFT